VGGRGRGSGAGTSRARRRRVWRVGRLRGGVSVLLLVEGGVCGGSGVGK